MVANHKSENDQHRSYPNFYKGGTAFPIKAPEGRLTRCIPINCVVSVSWSVEVGRRREKKKEQEKNANTVWFQADIVST
jgi:hypothetical protein